MKVQADLINVITANELAYDNGALRTNFRHMGHMHLTSSGSLDNCFQATGPAIPALEQPGHLNPPVQTHLSSKNSKARMKYEDIFVGSKMWRDTRASGTEALLLELSTEIKFREHEVTAQNSSDIKNAGLMWVFVVPPPIPTAVSGNIYRSGGVCIPSPSGGADLALDHISLAQAAREQHLYEALRSAFQGLKSQSAEALSLKYTTAKSDRLKAVRNEGKEEEGRQDCHSKETLREKESCILDDTQEIVPALKLGAREKAALDLTDSRSQAEQPQLSQPVLVGEMLQPSDHFCGPPLDLLQELHVLLVLRAPELDAVLQYRQVLFSRAAFDHIIPQPALKPRISPTQVKDPALRLVEPHEVHTGPLLQLVHIPLDDIPSFWCVNCSTQLGVICTLAEGALDLTVNVIDENIEQHWSQTPSLKACTNRSDKV
ncbi:hypothetical protein QYF61_013888 [Mycteria americana]|uniref:Uncharacterized protein n=1 Tax=Mycteria americana TaxID=33587 RepID=A0AAN7MYU7_MYCAM|nr:hypothetical protein QYF61_013888 [Mycteria americana]